MRPPLTVVWCTALQSEVSDVCGDREYEEALEQCQEEIERITE